MQDSASLSTPHPALCPYEGALHGIRRDCQALEDASGLTSVAVAMAMYRVRLLLGRAEQSRADMTAIQHDNQRARQTGAIWLAHPGTACCRPRASALTGLGGATTARDTGRLRTIETWEEGVARCGDL
jgi:hypothetical protein